MIIASMVGTLCVSRELLEYYKRNKLHHKISWICRMWNYDIADYGKRSEYIK